MRIAFVSPEAAPFAHTGGLGDVAGALPKALSRLGHDPSFNRDGLYQGPSAEDYPDNAERFALFCRSVLETCRSVDFQPEVLHAHDWQTALLPVYLRTILRNDPFFQRTATVFTIHNLGYQGLFPPEVLPRLMQIGSASCRE